MLFVKGYNYLLTFFVALLLVIQSNISFAFVPSPGYVPLPSLTSVDSPNAQLQINQILGNIANTGAAVGVIASIISADGLSIGSLDPINEQEVHEWWLEQYCLANPFADGCLRDFILWDVVRASEIPFTVTQAMTYENLSALPSGTRWIPTSFPSIKIRYCSMTDPSNFIKLGRGIPWGAFGGSGIAVDYLLPHIVPNRSSGQRQFIRGEGYQHHLTVPLNAPNIIIPDTAVIATPVIPRVICHPMLHEIPEPYRIGTINMIRFNVWRITRLIPPVNAEIETWNRLRFTFTPFPYTTDLRIDGLPSIAPPQINPENLPDTGEPWQRLDGGWWYNENTRFDRCTNQSSQNTRVTVNLSPPYNLGVVRVRAPNNQNDCE